jgi:ElaB/YqjD/DUF883 family membrane-anchored ribosome-binding protein
MNTELLESKEKLITDFKTVVADTEELLKATASAAGEQANVARSRVRESLAQAKVKLAASQDVAVERSREAAKATDEYVRDHPWQAIGLAASIGLVVGVLIARR